MSGAQQRLVLVTGLSGAGKSVALKYLEDLGFQWVDNPPMELIPQLAELSVGSGRHVAVGVHLREPDPHGLIHLQELCRERACAGLRVESLYLEANVEMLVTRYRETRRRHPLALGVTVREAVEREIAFQEPLREMADLVVDTSNMTPRELKELLDKLYDHDAMGEDLTVFLRSFGFKHGANTDADMVFDGRFLANPHYDPQLRHLSGLDAPVRDFLERDDEAERFLTHMVNLLDYLIPRFRAERKRYLTIDIGCTGGRHRSVYLVERLRDHLNQHGHAALVRHRDLDRHHG
ncbi:RNase adapter RapZ [Magnetofaba australis]|uniref:Putative ATPase n=1 Tax=Magnetofaba australis IT-1 TaxID=1434232 RepID=A0A1Y2K0Y3_9PROT|nr:RNase adapter RapZ [Magnetofaba australis]OSM01632.1 putative ATPase [Magnetofaba australis IT-1]